MLLILNRLSTFHHERTSDLLELTRKGEPHLTLDLLSKLVNGMVHAIMLEILRDLQIGRLPSVSARPKEATIMFSVINESRKSEMSDTSKL